MIASAKPSLSVLQDIGDAAAAAATFHASPPAVAAPTSPMAGEGRDTEPDWDRILIDLALDDRQLHYLVLLRERHQDRLQSLSAARQALSLEVRHVLTRGVKGHFCFRHCQRRGEQLRAAFEASRSQMRGFRTHTWRCSLHVCGRRAGTALHGAQRQGAACGRRVERGVLRVLRTGPGPTGVSRVALITRS